MRLENPLSGTNCKECGYATLDLCIGARDHERSGPAWFMSP